MIFYPGLHQPSDAQHFERACIHWQRLGPWRRRLKGDCKLIVDSRAFTEVITHGGYRHGPEQYAREIDRLSKIAHIEIAVSQDFMCEPFAIQRTGLSVSEHQRLTIERYDALLQLCESAPIMPVLQGYAPDEYVQHIAEYGERLQPGMWVGVGSVCKRNAAPASILRVLQAIHNAKPGLRLHAFGLKITSLRVPAVRSRIFSADSMAWCYNARMNGRNGNDWREARGFAERIQGGIVVDGPQMEMAI